MGIFVLIDDGDIVELDIEVLINRMEGSTYCQIILELDCDLQCRLC